MKKISLFLILTLLSVCCNVHAEISSVQICDGYINELEELIDNCEEKGFEVNYETLDLAVIKKFKKHIEEDIANGDESRLDYTMSCLLENYTHAKNNLTAYLDGSKKPKTVPVYQTGAVGAEKSTLLADMKANNEINKRPAFLVGYGYFGGVKRDMEILPDFGVNMIQTEIGIVDCVKRNFGLEDWAVIIEGGAVGVINSSDADYYEGTRSASINTDFDIAPNCFISLSQEIKVKPNTYYEIGFYIKSDKCTGVTVSTNNWTDSNSLDGTYSDWTKKSYAFLTGNNDTERVIRFAFNNLSVNTNIDNVYVKELGKDNNLISNGDFETVSEDQLSPYSEGVKGLCDTLENAEKNNISVCVLLSPHYFPSYLYELYPEIKMGTSSYIPFDINHPAAKNAIKLFVDTVIPLIKDYKSLNSICLTNEPAFFPNSNSAYNDDWAEWLENKYGDIKALNNKWGTHYLSFSRVSMPMNFNLESDIIKDYKDFNDEIFSRWHKWYRDLIKAYAPDIPIHAKTMTYIENAESDNIRYMLSQGLDFDGFSKFSDWGGCDGWISPYSFERTDQTLRSPQELFFTYDLMTSIKNIPVANTELHLLPDGSDDYKDSFDDCFGAAVWQGIIHKCNATAIWLWERAEDGDETFNGSISYRPDCVTEVGRTSLDANRLAYEITALQQSEEEVGIIYSAEARVASRAFMNACFNSYLATVYNGKKVKFITDETIDNIDGCKVIIVPFAKALPETMKNRIKEFSYNGGKVVIVGESCISDGDIVNSEKIDVEIDDIYVTSPTISQLRARFEQIFDDCGLASVKLVDKDTMQTVDNVEWTYAVYDNELIINILNYDADDKNKEIIIMTEGKPAEEIYELRDDVLYEDSLNVGFSKPVLVKVKSDLKIPVLSENEGQLMWEKTNGGAEVYKADDNGVFRCIEHNNSGLYNLNYGETIMIKTIDSLGRKSLGNAFTLSEEKLFSVQNLNDGVKDGNFEVEVTNIQPKPSRGILRFDVYDENGKIVKTAFTGVYLKGGQSKIVTCSLKPQRDTDIFDVKVYDGLDFKRIISE